MKLLFAFFIFASLIKLSRRELIDKERILDNWCCGVVVSSCVSFSSKIALSKSLSELEEEDVESSLK